VFSLEEKDWHPFHCFNKDGAPIRFDLLKSLSDFLPVFNNSKALVKAPYLITEGVNVEFTVYINWLNHTRVVNFMHVFWYIEFKTRDIVISPLTLFSRHSGAFMWTTPLSKEWAGLFLRHSLLEASPTNTSYLIFTVVLVIDVIPCQYNFSCVKGLKLLLILQ
jgi:hypothetical protein